MLFWTVVLFIAYSLVYFIFSQIKMKRLQNDIVALKVNLYEKNHQVQRKSKPHYETKFAGWLITAYKILRIKNEEFSSFFLWRLASTELVVVFNFRLRLIFLSHLVLIPKAFHGKLLTSSEVNDLIRWKSSYYYYRYSLPSSAIGTIDCKKDRLPGQYFLQYYHWHYCFGCFTSPIRE